MSPRLNRLVYLAAALFCASPALAQTRPSPDPTRDLDVYVARAVTDWRVPGLAIAVVKDGRVVFAKGYGVRELGKPAPVDTQTLFAIANFFPSATWGTVLIVRGGIGAQVGDG